MYGHLTYLEFIGFTTLCLFADSPGELKCISVDLRSARWWAPAQAMFNVWREAGWGTRDAGRVHRFHTDAEWRWRCRHLAPHHTSWLLVAVSVQMQRFLRFLNLQNFPQSWWKEIHLNTQTTSKLRTKERHTLEPPARHQTAAVTAACKEICVSECTRALDVPKDYTELLTARENPRAGARVADRMTHS